MHEEHQYAVRAIRAGASGYLTKESASRQLVEAIRKVAGGGAFISAEVAQQLALGAMPGATGPLHGALSDREYQVFLLIARGKSISDIGEALSLSVKTVSTHKANILQKMGMQTAGDLIRYALAQRLVEGADGG
jgi:DNA-binding NarL/FixJ family response regulator